MYTNRLKEKPPLTDKEIIDALTMIKISGKSFREVVLLSGIPTTTLHYYANRVNDPSTRERIN